jgi:hypothetical protein
MARHDRDFATANTKLGCKKCYELFVGRAIDGRRVQPHFQCRSMQSCHFGTRRARLNVNGKPHPLVDARQRQLAHRRRSTASWRKPSRKYAMIGVMSIGPIVGMTCRNGLRIGSLIA